MILSVTFHLASRRGDGFGDGRRDTCVELCVASTADVTSCHVKTRAGALAGVP